MSGSINLGNLPSWILITLIGIGIKTGISQGIVPTGLAEIGNLMTFGGLVLGAIYFTLDLSNKIGT
jgi:hypothetical protein